MSSSEGGHTVTVILQPAQFGALIERARRAGQTPGQAAHAAVMASLGPRPVPAAAQASEQSEELRERCADAEAKVLSLTAKLEARDGQVRQMEAVMAELRKEAEKLRLDITGLKIAVTKAEADAEMAASAQLADERLQFEVQVEQLRSRLFEMEVTLAPPVQFEHEGKRPGAFLDEAPQNELSDEQLRLVSAYRSAGWTARSISREMNITLVAVKAALGRS